MTKTSSSWLPKRSDLVLRPGVPRLLCLVFAFASSQAWAGGASFQRARSSAIRSKKDIAIPTRETKPHSSLQSLRSEAAGSPSTDQLKSGASTSLGAQGSEARESQPSADVTATPPRRFDLHLRETGGVGAFELVVGIPGVPLAGKASLGFFVEPRDPTTGKRLKGAYGRLSIDAAAFKLFYTLSTHSQYTGLGWGVGPVVHGDRVTGDQVAIPIGPLGTVFASRKGGLGVESALTPAPFFLSLYPLVRSGGSIYLTNPLLSGTANWVLDRNDQFGRFVAKKTAPLRNGIKARAPTAIRKRLAHQADPLP